MDEVAGAIADPVRREILVMLRAGRMPAGRIADRFGISRPAVSRHLRVLRESGLVHDEMTGRQRLYRLDPAPLVGLAEWLAPFVTVGEVGAWEHHFDALETEVYRTRRERRGRPVDGLSATATAQGTRRAAGGRTRSGPHPAGDTNEREERSA